MTHLHCRCGSRESVTCPGCRSVGPSGTPVSSCSSTHMEHTKHRVRLSWPTPTIRSKSLLIIITFYSACTSQHRCKQEAQLSQRDRAAARLNFAKNISAKSVHLTLLYVTALTSPNHHFTVLRHHVCT